MLLCILKSEQGEVMALTARISPESDAIINEIMAKTGKSKIEIIQKALEYYRLKERMRSFNESYDRLKADKKTWKQELKERQELEGTLLDGLEEY
jgi:hypothetical protein